MAAQRVISSRKPIFYHFKVYVYKVYIFIKSKDNPNKFGRLQKLVSRAYIGYLVGYKSTNIYKVWIFYKKKVMLARDVIFNEEVFFDGKPTKITTKLIIALDEVINLVEI